MPSYEMLPESYRTEYTGVMNNQNNMKMTFNVTQTVPAVTKFTNTKENFRGDSSAFQKNVEGLSKDDINSNKFLSGQYSLKNRTMIGGT